MIRTNLIDSYELLMDFARKHLPDKFFLEDAVRKSLRNIIVREMIGNTLIHREFTSSYMAKFVIEKDRMYVENANRAIRQGLITPDNLEPTQKNPIISAFFRNIGFADQLGSGTRNLFKYGKYYSGQEPKMIEGDIFRIIVPLDDEYSYDYNFGKNSGYYIRSETKSETKHNEIIKLSLNEKNVLSLLKDNAYLTVRELNELTGIPIGTVKRILPRLQHKGFICRIGTNRSGKWEIKK